MPSATLAPATPQPTIAGLSTSTLTILATFTATAPAVPVSSSTAKYELMTQSPDDQTKIAPNTFFHMVWTVKNTGTETWGKNYTIVFFTGNRLGGGDVTKTSYEFGEEVEPGDTIQLTVEMLTPAKEDTYLSWWKLRDDQCKNFGDVSVTIICTEEVASSG